MITVIIRILGAFANLSILENWPKIPNLSNVKYVSYGSKIITFERRI
jgi:hypothetical protein